MAKHGPDCYCDKCELSPEEYRELIDNYRSEDFARAENNYIASFFKNNKPIVSGADGCVEF